MGTSREGKKRMHDILDAIVFLKSHGLRGAGVIGAYHARMVAPLMACALPMYGMMPDAKLDGMVLAQGPLCDSEVARRIKEATKEFDAVFLILGHPAMQPDVGFVELPTVLGFQTSITPLPEHAAMRGVNHVIDEKRKKKDDKKAKQQAKLNR